MKETILAWLGIEDESQIKVPIDWNRMEEYYKAGNRGAAIRYAHGIIK